MKFALEAGPLSGLRILDLGHLLAGPFAATLLGDFGADVIKVERPTEGDAMRQLGPKDDFGSVWWKSIARNKRSIELDWATEPGKETLRRLVESADVVIENFRPGVLERNGFGPERLLLWNESLIVLRVSGYGQTGPYRERPGFGKAAEAFSGVVHLTGMRDGPPLHTGFPLGDMTTGLMGAYGVVLALLGRERGLCKGQVIDLPIYETLLRLIDFHVPVYSASGKVTDRNGNQQPLALGFSGIFRSMDGVWISFTAGTLNVAKRVLNLVGGSAYAENPRFATMAGVSARADEICELVEDWMAERTADEVLGAFQEAQAVAARVYTPEDILADPHIKARANVTRVPGNALDVVGVVPRLSATPGKIRWLGPDRVGQHTADVLASLECTEGVTAKVR